MTLPTGVTHPALDAISQRWRETEHAPHAPILQLVLLRELSQALHRERAQGPRPQLKPIEHWMESALQSCVAPEIHPTYPTHLAAALDRVDRKWERRLANAALHHRWNFSFLTAWIRVESAQHFHQTWSQHDWTHMAVLFVESGPDLLTGPPGLWQGRWHLIHAPEIKPDLETFKKIPGYSSTPTPAAWHAVS